MSRAPRSVSPVLAATLAMLFVSVLAGCASDAPDAGSPARSTASTTATGFSPITVYPVGTTTTTTTLAPGTDPAGGTTTTLGTTDGSSASSTIVGASNEVGTMTVNPGPELKIADAISVADCIRYIPIGAVQGDKEAGDLWAVIGQDLDELSGLCIGLVATSPSTLASLSLKLAAFELAQAPVAAAGATTTSGVGGSAASSAAMPDVVCTSLQDAQAQIVAVAGEILVRSFDASGDDRTPSPETADWLVVTQSPEPGAPFGDGDALLGAVKYGEPSDC